MNNAEETLTILGPPEGITINGQFDFGLIEVEDSVLNLKNLTLTEGSDSGGWSGVLRRRHCEHLGMHLRAIC